MQIPENIAQVVSFAERVFTFFSHAEGRDDLNTPGHIPDWKDSPARFRGYPDQAAIPLPAPEVLFARFKGARSGGKPAHGAAEVDRLCLLLYLAFAPLRRQLSLNWNHLHLKGLTTFRGQDFARGAASGGGLYPTQCYLLEGRRTSLRPGLYHYSNGMHALTPLRMGDFTRALAKALGSKVLHTRYLLLTSDFWRNCFKYNNFGYHVCTQDIGAAVGMLEVGADVVQLPARLHLHFCGEQVDALLGLDGVHESAFAILALGDDVRDLPSAPLGALNNDLAAVPPPWQRSRRAVIPAELQQIHRVSVPTLTESTLPLQTWSSEQPLRRGSEFTETSAPEGMFTPDGVTLPVTPLQNSRIEQQLDTSLVEVLHRRRSSWSSMSGASPLPLASLQEVLCFMQSGAKAALFPSNLRLCLKVSDIAGLPAGTYDWDASARHLLPRPTESVNSWQHTYAMDNYNVDEAAAVLFVVGDLSRALAKFGAGGYRLLNIQIGRLAQRAYLGAAALDLAAGVVLGVRAMTLKRLLQLPEPENVFLAIYLGPAQPKVELFNFRLVEGPSFTQEAV